MLRTISKSSNKKLGPCASTYRSGNESVYATCPTTCQLKPSSEQGSGLINQEYLDVVVHAVPKEGRSWTYSHFNYTLLPITVPGQTCINVSADTVAEAVESIRAGYPTVVVVPKSYDAKVDRVSIPNGEVRMVRCPAEYQDQTTCYNCGSGSPLCARHERDYVIKFTAHGNQAKKILMRVEGQTSDTGGCYGNSGPVRLQWEKTRGVGAVGVAGGALAGPEDSQRPSDAEQLARFVEGLPEGTLLRHHVVGDLG